MYVVKEKMFNLIQNVIKKENKILVMKTVIFFVYLIWLTFY